VYMQSSLYEGLVGGGTFSNSCIISALYIFGYLFLKVPYANLVTQFEAAMVLTSSQEDLIASRSLVHFLFSKLSFPRTHDDF